MRLLSSYIALLTLVCVATVSAGARPQFSLELKGGWNRATMDHSLLPFDEGDVRTGAIGGVAFGVHASDRFTLQAEFLYVRKGSEVRPEGRVVPSVPQSFISSRLSYVSLDYLDIPILLRADVPSRAWARGKVFAGPVVSYLISAQRVTNTSGTSGNAEISKENIRGDIRKIDFSVVLGGGFDFPTGPVSITTELRLTVGLRDLAWNNDKTNNVISAMLGFSLPIGERTAKDWK